MKTARTHGRTFLLTLATVAPFAACGDDGTSPNGDDNGRVEAFVSDDTQSGQASEAATASAASTLSGTVTGNFQASIQSQSGTWVDLGSPNGITVLLGSSGASSTVHGAQSVAVGTYTRARIVITNGQARVSAGSQIGGITLQSDATVTLGGGSAVVIEKAVGPFQVTASGRTAITFDLNAEAWINQTTTTTGAVSEGELRSHVTAVATASGS